MSRPPSEPPRCLAVLRFSALGDVLLTAPALEALKTAWPSTRILYVVKERFAPLVQHSPHVDEVVAVREGEGPWSISRRLVERGATALLDLHGKIRSQAIRALLPHLPRWAWHQRDLAEVIPVKLGLRPYRASMRVADRFHVAVERMVGRELPRGRLRYFPGADDQARVDPLLQGLGWDPSRPLIGMSPGASWQTKRWPADRFAELARRGRDAGYQVAVQGSTEERELVAEVVAAAPGALDLSGVLDLPSLGAFVSRCAAFVANDTGPMHLARALGVPTLAVFGSTDPGMFDFAGHEVLFAQLPCSPCSYFGRATCPRGHFRCMLDLDAERGWLALRRLLEMGRPNYLTA